MSWIPKARGARLGLGVVFGSFAQLSAIGLLLAASWLIVRAAEHPPVLFLMVAIVSVRFFGISRSVFRYVERLLTHDVALEDSIDQRIETYRELDRVAPRGLAGTRRGDVVSRVIADVTTLQDKLLRVRVPWWTGLVSAVVVVAIVSWIDLASGAVVAVSVVLAAVGMRTVVGALGAKGRATWATSRGTLAADVSELVIAAPDVVAAGGRSTALNRAKSATSELSDIQISGAVTGGLGSGLVLAITGMAVASIAVVSAGVDPVLIAVVLLAPVGLTEPLDTWSDAERIRPIVGEASRRLDAIAELPDSVRMPASPQPLTADSTLVADSLGVGWLDVPAVSDISFTLKPGHMMAISGPSGVGKSTLAFTLLRLLDPIAGRASLGGVELSQTDPAEVRTRIGYLGQDEAVFNTSIRENLRIADSQADDERLMVALKQAGLDTFVESLPQGLDTMVGEHGGSLSGGERQRLCLARILLGNHEVLIVDEPTEHLDADAAESLMDDLVTLVPGRSLICISHAPAVLDRFDTVVTLRAAHVRHA